MKEKIVKDYLSTPLGEEKSKMFLKSLFINGLANMVIMFKRENY